MTRSWGRSCGWRSLVMWFRRRKMSRRPWTVCPVATFLRLRTSCLSFQILLPIDHFKEAICNSLEEYNQHIEELKQEMEEATESAKRIREDIQEMRNKYGVVESQEKCATCDFPLLNRPFYLFLCGHMFHYDCLFTGSHPSPLCL